MKKFLALAMALIMALVTLAGCGGNEIIASLDPTEAPETNTEAPAIRPTEASETNTEAPAVKPGANADAGDLISHFAVAKPAKAEYPVNPSAAANEDGDVDWDDYETLYEKWWVAKNICRDKIGKTPDMNSFLLSLTAQLMKMKAGENVAFSPANVYIALAMLAETTDGSTRAEILSVLGSPDIETLRSQTAALLSAESWDDGVQKTALANSIWMNKDIVYNADTLGVLADIYGAASFSGDMSQEEYSKALCAWLDENTGGLLKDAIDGTHFDPDTVMAIASTIYFKDAWEHKFNKDMTEKDIFHAASGDIECDFMHGTLRTECFGGDNFIAMRETLESGACVYMLLPDEGVTVDEMIAGGALDSFGHPGAVIGEGWSTLDVKLSVPKLDISTKAELKEALAAMGIRDCFNMYKADFTPLTDLPNVYVDEVTHAARIKTDEDGVEAAAYTLIMAKAGGAFTEFDSIELNFNRPFALVVTGSTFAPLFVGVVNTPTDR